jgi:ubiquinone/menaquinone biosynthesis C-methylase UbiE
MEKHSPFHDKKSGEDLAPQTQGQVIHWPVFYELIIRVVTRGKEKAFRGFVNDLVGLQPGETVLEVGCGTGTQALLAKESVGETGRVSAIEPSLEMVAYARRKATRRGLVVDIQPGVIERLDFPDKSLDVILCIIVLHHMPDETKVQGIKEMARVLKPDGRLLVVDSNLDLLPSFEREGFAQVKAGEIQSVSGYDFILWRMDPVNMPGWN